MTSYLDRVIASSADRVTWMRERSRGITATDAAKLATPHSVHQAVWEKQHLSFGGSAYTEHGKTREPIIAAWAAAEFGIEPSTLLFHAEQDRRHLATPDGLRPMAGGGLELCEIKTTAKPWRSIPRHYLRQVWWQQYVLGAERTLVVWEEHHDFVPIGTPRYRWVERDESQIERLVWLAESMLDELERTEP